MSMLETPQGHISATQGLLQRVEALCEQQQVEGRVKLCRDLQAHLGYLRRVEAGKVNFKESSLQSTNLTNLTHLKAMVQAAESLQDVVGVFHEFPYLDRGGAKQCLAVDVVANGGRTWVKVIARKAEALHNIWQGQERHAHKSIISHAEDFVEARRQPFGYSKPHVIFAFYNGVSSPMADALKRMGIFVRGDIVAVNADDGGAKGEGGEEHELIDREEEEDEEEAAAVGVSLTRVDPDTVVEHLYFPLFPELKVEECHRVNLDSSTLITYVSSLSHGHCNFSSREASLTEQVAQERQEPVLPGLDSFMKDKELFACQTAVQSFQFIVEKLGEPEEKRRAEELLSRVRVVPDQPSELTQRLMHNSKINGWSKYLMIFGTGDTLRAITMTANSRFVKSAASQGVRYGVFLHQTLPLKKCFRGK